MARSHQTHAIYTIYAHAVHTHALRSHMHTKEKGTKSYTVSHQPMYCISGLFFKPRCEEHTLFLNIYIGGPSAMSKSGLFWWVHAQQLTGTMHA